MDVGTQLREARQGRGLTLHDVAVSTKVSRQTLDHIDHNRFSRLPGGILTKGHLRAYATEVGLNPEQIVREYFVQCFGESGEELPIVPPSPVEGATHSGRFLLIEIIVIGLAIALFASYRRSADSPAGAPSIEAETLQATSELALLEGAVLPGVLRANESESGFQIEIRPSGPCWVSATADDRLVVYRLLQRGDHAVVTAREELMLRVGDPETLVYWLNGALGRPLGQAGEPVTVRITEDNYKTFLADSARRAAQRSPTS